MTTNQILNLDYRLEENKKIIQKVLRQIKPLSRCSEDKEVPIEYLEKAITVMSKKYKIRVRSISPDVWTNEKYSIWRATIISDKNLQTIGMVWGVTIYEVLAKICIKMYSEIRR